MTPTEVLARYCGSHALNAPTSNAIGALTALRENGYEIVSVGTEAAHELMATQFKTLQQERAVAWAEADKQEAAVERLGVDLANERKRADLLEQARQGWEDRAHAAEATLARVQDLLDTYKRYPNRASPCIVADLTTALDGEVPDA